MDPRNPSYEANLLFNTGKAPDIDQLVEDIQETLEAHSTNLICAEIVDGVFTLLTCDKMQILLAFTEGGLPVEHFLQAQRPAAAVIGDTEILSKLNRHCFAMTVLVVDNEAAGPERRQWHSTLRRNLCWELVDCISQTATPELMFWCDTDTLYTFDEFQRACSFIDERLRDYSPAFDGSCVPFQPRHFPQEPMISQSTLDWIDQKMDEAREVHHPTPKRADQSASDSVIKLRLPDLLARHLDRLLSKEKKLRGLRTAAMVCAAAMICAGGLHVVPFVYY